MSDTKTVPVPVDILRRIVAMDPIFDADEDGTKECYFCRMELPYERWSAYTQQFFKPDDRWGRQHTEEMYGHDPDCPFFALKRIVEE